GDFMRFALERVDRVTPLLCNLATISMLVFSSLLLFCCKNTSQILQNAKPTNRAAMATVFLLLAAILSLGGESAFLYFNF
ncbi:MAG: hypothetical protein LBM69_03375, partial [Lachnospiraceae bacterium]|nr:hypothetical protein [Lachnospiraceae bacterium]